jgi:hypothetical protein
VKNRFETAVRILGTAAVLSWPLSALRAEAPPKLPGQDITGSVANMPIAPDSSELKPPSSSPLSPEWIEQGMNTWDAPGLFQQINEDATIVPIGKGAVFIPRLSDAALEPTAEIFNETGKLVASGPSGKKYPLLPGEYALMVGSGSINQRITKKVFVEEGKIVPIIPDWCGLSIDVVDSNNVPFRGQYEMARIDDFDAYGRSYGRDITVGERIKTWILKAGLYKIFSAGDSYNTVNNFITVRLVPGEFASVIVVESQKDLNLKIVGGGEVNTKALSAKKKSHWKYNFNVGGTILFNSNSDRVVTTNTQNSANLALLSISDITYKKGTNDWETNVFLKEGVNLSDLSHAEANYTADQFTLTSLYVWRVILPWLGPYCRTEFQTHLLPGVMQFDEKAPNHFFITIGPDSAVKEIDSSHTSKQVQPSFSPMTGEAGIGANIDAITSRYFDAKFRLGVGYSQMNVWGQKYQRDTTYLTARKIAPGSGLTNSQLTNALTRNYVILQESQYVMSTDYGPEAGMAIGLRVGNWAIVRGDYRVRIPIDPLIRHYGVRPDWDVYTTVSWSLTRSITLDYLLQYTLKQPIEEVAHVDVATNSIFLRFSFNTR